MRGVAALACVAALLAGCSADDGGTVAGDQQTTVSTTTTPPSTTTTTAPTGTPEVTAADRTFEVDGEPVLVRTWVPGGTGGDDRPLIVLAHGLAGEPHKFDELSSAWAEAGYVVAAPRFPNTSATGGSQVDGFTDQPAIVTAVIDQLAADPDLAVDEERIGVAGLSLGGSTIYALTTDPCCMDPRIKGAAIFDGVRPGAFGADPLVPNEVPVVILHCDEDFVLSYQDHAVAGFERMADPAWLITMPCAEHSEPFEDSPSAFDDLVEEVTLDLWASVLRDDPDATTRMVEAVDGDGRATVEVRGP